MYEIVPGIDMGKRLQIDVQPYVVNLVHRVALLICLIMGTICCQKEKINSKGNNESTVYTTESREIYNKQEKPVVNKGYRSPFDSVVINTALHNENGVDLKGWPLEEEHIQTFEPEILECIRINRPDLFKGIHNYRCQYFGIIKDGHRVVHGNFFRKDSQWLKDVNWKEQIHVVFGGGSDYFQVEYSLKDKKCVHFAVNADY